MTGSALVYGVLVVPCTGRWRRGDPELLLRRDRAGRAVLVAYPSVPALCAQLGDRQPWVAVPTGALDVLLATTGAVRLVVAPPEPW